MIASLGARRARAGVLLAACVGGLAAASAAAPATGARDAFSGNVCSLLTAKQVAAVVGDASAAGKYKCVASKSFKTPAGTNYAGHAGSGSVTAGGYFSIQVVKYSSAQIAGRVRASYKALMKPVGGVGDWAYEHVAMSAVAGGTADVGQFAFGAKGYGVLVNVRAPLKRKVSRPALTTLARKIAAEL